MATTSSPFTRPVVSSATTRHAKSSGAQQWARMPRASRDLRLRSSELVAGDQFLGWKGAHFTWVGGETRPHTWKRWWLMAPDLKEDEIKQTLKYPPSKEVEANLFAASLFPYLGFLWHLRKIPSPPLLGFGFTFLLVFVVGSIPAAVVALQVYDTVLANVDWLHGLAEGMLTVTNLFIVLGARKALKEAAVTKEAGQTQAPVETR